MFYDCTPVHRKCVLEVEEILDAYTLRGELAHDCTTAPLCTESVHNGAVEEAGDGKVRCLACAHACLLPPGKRGICGVRFNRNGELRVPWGYTAGMAVDPIEKKPFYHFLPGSQVFTFGMLGCNFHCAFCQNWFSAQAVHDPEICLHSNMIQPIQPEELVTLAIRSGAQVLASSYNEPIISAEWAHDLFQLAKKHDLRTVMVSNGFASRAALEYLRPVMDGYKIDLKSMRENRYREMGGRLQPVLDSIQTAWNLGFQVEVVTLVIPGFNDSPEELWDAASAIRSVSADIPWHVTAFHPDYQMLDHPSTASHQLQQAADIGEEAGLHFIYAGNLPGRVGSLENTYCPYCKAALVERRGFQVVKKWIGKDGLCPKCRQPVAGVWG